jgi:surface protein
MKKVLTGLMCLVSLSSIGGESNQLRFNKTDSADITVTEGIKDNCAEGNEKISRETLEGMIAAGNDVTGVCTSLITDMSRLFFQNKTFNQDISGWDVSNVTTAIDFMVGADSFGKELPDFTGISQ